MANKKRSNLQNRADTIANAQQDGENTAPRVGSLDRDTVDSMIQPYDANAFYFAGNWLLWQGVNTEVLIDTNKGETPVTHPAKFDVNSIWSASEITSTNLRLVTGKALKEVMDAAALPSGSVPRATEVVVGIVRQSTPAEFELGTNNDTYTTPKQVNKRFDELSQVIEDTVVTPANLQKVTDVGAKTSNVVEVSGLEISNLSPAETGEGVIAVRQTDGNFKLFRGKANTPTDPNGPFPTNEVKIDGPASITEGTLSSVYTLKQKLTDGSYRAFPGAVTWGLQYRPNTNITVGANTGVVVVPAGSVSPGDYTSLRASFTLNGVAGVFDMGIELIDTATTLEPSAVGDLFEFVVLTGPATVDHLEIRGPNQLTEGGGLGSYSIVDVYTDGGVFTHAGVGAYGFVGSYPNGMSITQLDLNAATTEVPAGSIESDVTITMKYTPAGGSAITLPILLKNVNSPTPGTYIVGYQIDGPVTMTEGGPLSTFYINAKLNDGTYQPYGGLGAWSLKIPYPDGMSITKGNGNTANTKILANSITGDGILTVQFTAQDGTLVSKAVNMINGSGAPTVVSYNLTGAVTLLEGGDSGTFAVNQLMSSGESQQYLGAGTWSLKAGFPVGMTIVPVAGTNTATSFVPANSITGDGTVTVQFTLPNATVLTYPVNMINGSGTVPLVNKLEWAYQAGAFKYRATTTAASELAMKVGSGSKGGYTAFGSSLNGVFSGLPPTTVVTLYLRKVGDTDDTVVRTVTMPSSDMDWTQIYP